MCCIPSCSFFFFNDTATTEIYTLSLHDALPIYGVLLEHDPAVRPRSLHRDPIHLDHAVPVGEEPREDVEEGGLAATARAHHRGQLALAHLEAHPLEGLDVFARVLVRLVCAQASHHQPLTRP